MKTLLQIAASCVLALLFAWWMTDGNPALWPQSLFNACFIVSLPYLSVPVRWGKMGYALLGIGIAVVLGLALFFIYKKSVEQAAIRAVVGATVITVIHYLIQGTIRKFTQKA